MKMMGTERVACCAGRTAAPPLATITSGGTLQQFSGGGSNPITVPHAPVVVDLKIAARHPSQILKSFLKGCCANLTFPVVLDVEHQYADAPHSVSREVRVVPILLQKSIDGFCER
jgi:hypothetical protein